MSQKDYFNLGYRPYFVYRILSHDIIMVNGPEHQFSFYAFKHFNLFQVAQVDNPGRQSILCACESNDHIFVATQGKHVFVLNKKTFTLMKAYSTLQLVTCLERIDSPSGTIILIGMQQKYFGSIKIMENSFDFEEIDLQQEVGHCLAFRQIVFDQLSQSFLVSHFGKKLEFWKIINFEDIDSRQEVVHGRHLVMELANYWDRDVGILGQSGDYFICFDTIAKCFCVLNPTS